MQTNMLDAAHEDISLHASACMCVSAYPLTRSHVHTYMRGHALHLLAQMDARTHIRVLTYA